MAFLETFLGAFLGVCMAEIGKEAYQRWFQGHVRNGFDRIDQGKIKIKEILK